MLFHDMVARAGSCGQTAVMKRSLIYVTTPTSGSQSIFRLLQGIYGRPTREGTNARKLLERPPTIADFLPHDELAIIRSTAAIAEPIHDERFLYVVNFRDPRDMFCNQYHWLLQHPMPDGTHNYPPDRIARAEAGIDASVLKETSAHVFQHVLRLAELKAAGAENILFVSYAQLCCAYDQMVRNLVDFIGLEPTAQSARAIAAEAPGALAENAKWIGNDWTGTDTMPGRYKRELKPETIAILDERWGPLLDRLAALDLPELRPLYAHGGPQHQPAGPA